MAAVVDVEHITPEEIREAIAHLSHTAKRCIPAVGSEQCPTKWDVAHHRIDDMLVMLELATT